MEDGKLGLAELQGTRTFISGHSVSHDFFLFHYLSFMIQNSLLIWKSFYGSSSVWRDLKDWFL